VAGVDVNWLKVDLMTEGRSPTIETGRDYVVKAARAAGRLRVAD
jgi:UDP-N-acetyl-D-mannosaminuronate dehydrogenase